MNFAKVLARVAAAAASVVMSGALLLLPTAAEEQPSFDVTVNAPPKIVFLGDSITAGYGLEGYDKDDITKCASYANILSEVFASELPEEAEFEARNMGRSGLSSDELLGELNDGLYDKALSDADAVVVTIGGNDMLGVFLDLIGSDDGFAEVIKKAATLSSDLDKSLEPFPENLADISEEIHTRAQKEDCKLFVQTLYDPFEGHTLSLLADISEEKIGKLNEAIFSGAQEGGYIVADVAGVFKGRNFELTNIADYDIHPNAAGHEVIAQTMRELIEEQTYTYHDYEAERRYMEEQQQKQEETEKEPKENSTDNRIYIIAVSAAVIVVVIISAAARSKKTKGK